MSFRDPNLPHSEATFPNESIVPRDYSVLRALCRFVARTVHRRYQDRANRRSPAATDDSGGCRVAGHIKTRDLSLRSKAKGCGNPPPDEGESRDAGSPVARLPLLGAQSVAIFRRSGFCGSAADLCPRPRLAGLAARLAKGAARLLPSSRRLCARLTSASFFIVGRRWPREEIRSLNPENAREPVHNVNAGSVDASLKALM